MLALITLLTGMVSSSSASAQLFGERRVGAPLRAAPSGAATAQNPGNLTGGERFLRGNRSRRDFVGSDRSESTGFVGAIQAIGVGRVPAATEGLRLKTSNSARINRPIPPLPAEGMYYPRLEIDFATEPRRQSELSLSTENRLQKRIQQAVGDGVRVDVQGRTARLSGKANSVRAAELAVILAGFEPGIDQVDNQLNSAK
ncbi:MAG: BON domain-containing protein [bacterium]|nr:BON domain-containing protein [bacterium]